MNIKHVCVTAGNRLPTRRVICAMAMLLCLVLFAGSAVACGKQSAEQQTQLSFTAMDTVISITLYGNDHDVAGAAAQQKIIEMEQLWSRTVAQSDITRMNTHGSLPLTALDDRTVALIALSQTISQSTQGTFDIALGNLIALWGIGNDQQLVPNEEDIKIAQKKSGFEYVELGEAQVSLQNDVRLDVGAVAKGATADEVVKLLNTFDLQGGILSLGGDVICFGNKQDGEAWRVGISDPARQNAYLGYLDLTKDTAVVTSGDYERFFERSGVRYHHILDRSTGFPADNDLSSVSVVHDQGAHADAYSTALFVMGFAGGYKYAQTHGLQVVFVKKDGTVITTPNIAHLFTLTDTSYHHETP